MANTSEQLGINYLGNADNSVQEPLRKDLDSEITELNKLALNGCRKASDAGN